MTRSWTQQQRAAAASYRTCRPAPASRGRRGEDLVRRRLFVLAFGAGNFLMVGVKQSAPRAARAFLGAEPFRLTHHRMQPVHPAFARSPRGRQGSRARTCPRRRAPEGAHIIIAGQRLPTPGRLLRTCYRLAPSPPMDPPLSYQYRPRRAAPGPQHRHEPALRLA